ncbi:RNA polymerase I-specific transcription initiation factor RRN3-like [Babylonia areolata]|uniref:RNA polymerase I-specific transcription initiation factor RRN3-like n=1 Tax=Babylonia areolata TaxID=304850 RepID=UPI003FD3276F
MESQDQPRLRMDIAAVLRKQDQVQAPCREYDILLNFLATPDSEPQLLTNYLRQLRDCVTLVTKEHEQLVGIILNMDWLSRDLALTQEYKPLILNLVSAHPYYLRACLRMLVRKFLPQATSKRTGGDRLPDKATKEREEAMFSHVHELLRAVASIVPSTRTVVMQLMRESFPYHTRDVYTHEAYTRNLLLVIQYIPDLRRQIFELLVEKMLQLDVRAPRNDIVEAEESSDEEDADAQDGAMFKMDGIEEGNKENKAKAAPEDVTSLVMNHEEALRLDVMMDLTLNYIHSTCHPKGVLDWEVTKTLYRELLSVFDLLIFPTHASCHAQFLLFYIISFRKELLVGFLDYLWKKVKTPMTQNVFRQAAAGYLGSLLARAAFMDISTLKTTVKIMTDWLHEYLQQTGSDVLHADLAHHAPFYAVCQSVFYAFSFRSQQLLEIDKGYKWADSLGFQRLVNCKLNPLRVCLPLICTTFASVTRVHQLALCDTVIQRNNRLKFISSQDTLEAYFPFDPYLLKRSGRWIKSLYREYEGILPDIKRESDDEEDEDDFIPDEDMEASLGVSSVCTSADKLDFMKYSISPGFKL